MEEYIVTLKRWEDIEGFYRDMESESDIPHLPKRPVGLSARRPNSRNTNYRLTSEEAKELKKDPRVADVNKPIRDVDIQTWPLWNQSENNWDKSASLNWQYKNWGLLRCSLDEQIVGWGSDNVASKSGTVTASLEGDRVDVVIVDGHIYPQNPEFFTNPDGTGTTRVIQHNWFQYEPNVSGGAAGTYPYPSTIFQYNRPNDNHGCHVAGIVAGNSNGWARKANVYNIYPYGTPVTADRLFEYIREFHLSKPLDEQYDDKNPTIVNNSWHFVQSVNVTEILEVHHRGNVYTGPFTTDNADLALLTTIGVTPVDTSTGFVTFGLRRADVEADIEDCVANGIIFVGAASDYSFKIDVPGGEDYDNFIKTASGNVYYHRGASPTSAIKDDGTRLTITVGATDSNQLEFRQDQSCIGPRIDVFAPGANIMSSVNGPNGYGGVIDRRIQGLYFTKDASGTSQAAAQVTGVIACWLEENRTANLAQVFTALYSTLSVANAIPDPVAILGVEDPMANYGNLTALLGSSNSMIYADFSSVSKGSVRPKVGVVYPTYVYGERDSGVIFPRYVTKTEH